MRIEKSNRVTSLCLCKKVKMVKNRRFLTPQQEQRQRVLSLTRKSRRIFARTRTSLNETVEVDRDPPLPRSFSFLVCDFTKVKEQCLSITYTFGKNNQISVRHPSYLPLVHGLCTLHSLGISSYVCQYCAAHSMED